MRLRSVDCALTSGAEAAGVEPCRRRVLSSEAGRGYRLSKGGEDDCGGGEDGEDDAAAPWAPKLKLCKSLPGDVESTISVFAVLDVDGAL